VPQRAQSIRHGRSTLIFPEGGRSETGELREFKDGAAFIAIRAQVPIVPMALIGMRQILPMHTLRFRRGHVKLRIGQPIETQGMTIKQREALTAQALHELRAWVYRLCDAVKFSGQQQQCLAAFFAGQYDDALARELLFLLRDFFESSGVDWVGPP